MARICQITRLHGTTQQKKGLHLAMQAS